MLPCFFFFPPQSFSFISTVGGLKCQMQMPPRSFLAPYCSLVFLWLLFRQSGAFDASPDPRHSQEGTRRCGVTHFRHLCRLPCVTAATCRYTSPAAHTQRTVCHTIRSLIFLEWPPRRTVKKPPTLNMCDLW